MSPLILLILGLSGVYCDGHALRTFRTIAQGPGLPAYALVTYLDNQQILKYTSDIKRYQATVGWMKKVNRTLLEWGIRRTTEHETAHKTNLQKIMYRFNHTAGLHIAQTMYGCELKDDGSTDVYFSFGYDGREFMFLNTQQATWIPIMNEAEILTNQFNSKDERLGEVHKRVLENDCVKFLKEFIIHAKEDLDKRVRPEVKVWGRRSGGETKLYCLVYGFHPRAVDVKWMRNGTDHIPSNETSPILPHPDGTYQIRISLEVPTREEGSFFCHVDHSSLEEILRVKWEPDNGRQSDVIVMVIAVIAGLAALAAVIAGVAFYIQKRGKKRTDYQLTRNNLEGQQMALFSYAASETSSPSTNNPTA